MHDTTLHLVFLQPHNSEQVQTMNSSDQVAPVMENIITIPTPAPSPAQAPAENRPRRNAAQQFSVVYDSDSSDEDESDFIYLNRARGADVDWIERETREEIAFVEEQIARAGNASPSRGMFETDCEHANFTYNYHHDGKNMMLTVFSPVRYVMEECKLDNCYVCGDDTLFRMNCRVKHALCTTCYGSILARNKMIRTMVDEHNLLKNSSFVMSSATNLEKWSRFHHILKTQQEKIEKMLFRCQVCTNKAGQATFVMEEMNFVEMLPVYEWMKTAAPSITAEYLQNIITPFIKNKRKHRLDDNSTATAKKARKSN